MLFLVLPGSLETQLRWRVFIPASNDTKIKNWPRNTRVIVKIQWHIFLAHSVLIKQNLDIGTQLNTTQQHSLQLTWQKAHNPNNLTTTYQQQTLQARHYEPLYWLHNWDRADCRHVCLQMQIRRIFRIHELTADLFAHEKLRMRTDVDHIPSDLYFC